MWRRDLCIDLYAYASQTPNKTSTRRFTVICFVYAPLVVPTPPLHPGPPPGPALE